VRLCEESPRVAAVGVNCTAPRHIPSLIAEMRRVTDKPLIVYPNLGETYDAATKRWQAAPDAVGWGESVRCWFTAGALGIGGCCRVGPREIAMIRQILTDGPSG